LFATPIDRFEPEEHDVCDVRQNKRPKVETKYAEHDVDDDEPDGIDRHCLPCDGEKGLDGCPSRIHPSLPFPK
jgi:hypothetical protein